MSRKSLFLIGFLLVLIPLLVFAQQERVDLNVLHQIKSEAIGPNSKVMEIMYNLTDRYGPRLTNSPQFRAAGEWAVTQLKEYGLSNVHLEKWGPFGNGWEYTSYSGAMMEPSYQPLIGTPVAWTKGTDGPVTGDAIIAVVQTAADMDKYHGQLKGKIVLASPMRQLELPETALGHRYTDGELAELATGPLPGPNAFGGRGGRGGQPNVTPEERRALMTRMQNFWREEQPTVVVQSSSAHDSGTIVGGGANREHTDNLPQVIIATEQYNRIARLLQHKVPVKLQFDIKTKFYTDNPDSFNVIAEIPGSAKANELVMLAAISIPGITPREPPTMAPAPP
jgi:hypothetical protein